MSEKTVFHAAPRAVGAEQAMLSLWICENCGLVIAHDDELGWTHLRVVLDYGPAVPGPFVGFGGGSKCDPAWVEYWRAGGDEA